MFNSKILTDNGVNIEKSLELFGDMNTYNESLIDFLKEVESKFEKLKNFKEIADMSNYSILVHSLKSDAKYFGFEDLANIAYEHEKESKANNMYYVSLHYDELEKEIKRIIGIVRTYLGVNVSDEKSNFETDNVSPKNNTILVVDDSNIIATFTTKIFNNQYNVMVAKDGGEAIDILAEQNNQIVGMLLDLNMPNVNGYEVLRFMKTNSLFEKIDVAIITGSDSKTVLDNVKEYPVMAILEKPFNEVNIKKVVDILVMHNKTNN